MKIIKFCEQGFFHKADSIPNQDCVRCFESDGIICAAVADGCSGAVWANIASKATVSYISYLFKGPFLKRIEKYLPNELIPELTAENAIFDERYDQALLSMICDSLKELVEHHLLDKYRFVGNFYAGKLKAGDFATTLTVLFICPDTGRMTTISVGDGFACVREPDGVRYISESENKGSPSRTYFITDKELNKHLRLNRYQSDSYSFILLSTDGLTKLHKDLDNFLSGLSFSPDITPEAVSRMFSQDRKLPDDVGYVLIINDNNKNQKENDYELQCIPQ